MKRTVSGSVQEEMGRWSEKTPSQKNRNPCKDTGKGGYTSYKNYKDKGKVMRMKDEGIGSNKVREKKGKGM